MKKLLLLLAITFSTASYSQLTDANFSQAIATCLSTNPIDGMCTSSEYGAMPDWDVSNVTDMQQAFSNKEDFNADISQWSTENVLYMTNMFNAAASFNQDISEWNTSNVTDMYSMFSNASSFNQAIGGWDVSKVTVMSLMFRFTDNFGNGSFNQPLNEWDVSNVTKMNGMFTGGLFNQPLNNWNVSSVNEMGGMFRDSYFNQSINDWNVTNVTYMGQMFYNADSFNQPLNNWDVSSVTDMNNMFYNNDSFNQDISSWDVSSVTDMQGMFNSQYTFSTNNYDALLISWSQQNVQSNVELQADNISFCNSVDERQSLIDNYGWIIQDGGLDCSTAGVDDQNQLDISIYPNPTSDLVYFEGNYTQLKVVIYNVLGKEILNKSITNSIDISHLDNGVYILQLSDGVKLSTRKIIKN